MYISNGSAIAVIRRSTPQEPFPDLFCMALLARFYGYFPGYSRQITDHHDYLTWVILKAHTHNRAGTVTLRSADPRDTPLVNFRYFEEGDDPGGDDLTAVVEGIRFVAPDGAGAERRGGRRRGDARAPIATATTRWRLMSATTPGATTRRAPARSARAPTGGVLDSDFTVHGTKGLRVVDASVFPRIPGYFIASAIYIIAEKAADAVLAAAMPAYEFSTAAPCPAEAAENGAGRA